MAYDTVKIIKELGDIIDDCGAIHLDIEANFVVFQPKPGKKIVVCIYIYVYRSTWFGQCLRSSKNW